MTTIARLRTAASAVTNNCKHPGQFESAKKLGNRTALCRVRQPVPVMDARNYDISVLVVNCSCRTIDVLQYAFKRAQRNATRHSQTKEHPLRGGCSEGA